MAASLVVKDYMNKAPLTATPDTEVEDLIKLILKHKVSGLVIADENNNFIGVVSELDCLRSMSDSLYHDGTSAQAMTAKDIMTTEVMTTTPNASLLDIVVSMLKEGQRRRPVLEDGKLVGQATCRQLLKAISSFA